MYNFPQFPEWFIKLLIAIFIMGLIASVALIVWFVCALLSHIQFV
jgi:hypothetical protein